ncbi:MAG TPA: zinc ribbon domain-containing protein [Verrucomicrobiae bacterium]
MRCLLSWESQQKSAQPLVDTLEGAKYGRFNKKRYTAFCGLLIVKHRAMSSEIHHESPEPQEEQLCTSCAAPNEPSAHFCAKCGAPLSSYATFAPFERLFAEGFIYRQAAERPRRLITVLGIWFIFGLFGLGGLVIMIIASSAGAGLATVVCVGFGAALLVVSLVMIWKTTRNYLT